MPINGFIRNYINRLMYEAQTKAAGMSPAAFVCRLSCRILGLQGTSEEIRQFSYAHKLRN